MKLKVISDKSKEIERVLKESGEDNLDHASGWYLHGILEAMCGYDLATIYNMSDHRKEYKETLINLDYEEKKFMAVHKSHLQGIYPVEVYGVGEPCVGYFWVINEKECMAFFREEIRTFKHWNQRGLVVLESDREANEYAKKCYEENKNFL